MKSMVMGKGKKRQAEGRFNKFIQSQPSMSGLLPLTHIARAYTFAEILPGNRIEPQHCEIFDEELIYLFYGKPAYRAKDGNNARMEFEWPIVFIFDPEKLKAIKRVFPFDSGAFELKFYKSFFDSGSKIEDFSVDPNLESAQKIVGAFYVNNFEYWAGDSRKNVELPSFQFEAQGVFEMIRSSDLSVQSSGNSARDERSSAIELQVTQEIDLKDALVAIVLPNQYLEEDAVTEALTRWGPQKVETYETLHNLGGEAWVGMIYQKVRDIYSELGCLT